MMMSKILSKGNSRGARHLMIGLLFVAVAALSARAQLGTATINGNVTDSSGAAIAGAKITATDTAAGLQVTTETGEDGHYALTNVRPGTYNIQVTAGGFSTSVRRNQVLLVGQAVTLDFTMQVASVAQTVTVESVTPKVSTTQSMLQTVIEPSEIRNLPSLSRSFSDLAALSPGVTVSTSSSETSNSGGTVTISNSQSFQVGWLIDGINAENTFYGGLMSKFAQDWVQEFSAVTTQAPAEYGNAAGGFINTVTRSGGNSVHGRAYGYYQNASLNATPYFSKASAKPPYNLERIGGMVGGPIKKNKLFYFLGYEYWRALQGITSVVPAGFGPASEPGVYTGTSTSHIAIAKVDWQKSDSSRFMFRFNTEYDFSSNTGLGGETSWGLATNPTARHWLPAASWTKVISPTEVNVLSGSYGRESEDGTCNYENLVGPYSGTGPNVGPLGNPTNWLAEINYPAAGIDVGCAQSGWAPGPYISWRQAYVNDTLSLSRGKHTFAVGAEPGYQQVWWGHTITDGIGDFTINSLVPFNPADTSTYPVADLMNGFGGPEGEKLSIYGPSLSFFVQDSYRVRPNLTLNIGLRYDLDFLNSWFTNNYINPAIKTGESASGLGPIVAPLNPVNNDYGNVAPRFGFAWAPFHDGGNTVLRGGVGVYYDESHSAVMGFEYGQAIGAVDPVDVNATVASLNPWCYETPCTTGVPAADQDYLKEILAYSLATYTVPNFTMGTYQMPQGGPTFTVPAPTVTVAGVAEPAPTTSGTIINDENLKTPGELQISAGIGHNFGGLNFTADYEHVQGFQQYVVRNTNINMQGTPINPLYGSVKGNGNGGIFKYNSLQVVASYRNHSGDLARVAYTLASAYNNGYGGFTAATFTGDATDPFNYNVDWGPAGIPLNTLVFNGAVHIPLGIVLAPIFTFSSAAPFQAVTTGAVPGCPVYYNQCYPIGYTRNSLRGADTSFLSARLEKTVRITESKGITFFVEAYNLLNHPNFGTDYINSVLSPKFMHPDNIATTMRQLQVGGEFNF